MTLRPYQIEAIEAMQASPNRNGLVVMPTGTGKTIVFIEFIKNHPHNKFLILTERVDLFNQTYNKLLALVSDRNIGRVGNGYRDIAADIIVATRQTLITLYEKMPFDYFDYILIDEAHHTKASSYKVLYDYFNTAKCFGFTATPNKISTIFEEQDTVFRYSLLQALDDGYLAPIEPFMVTLQYDFAKIKSKKNEDYTAEEIEEAIKKNIGTNFDAVYSTLSKYKLKHLVIYMPTINIAQQFTTFLKSQGRTAYCIDCNTPVSLREQYIEEFKSNPEVILVNIMILTEGIDIPEIESIIVCRPTKNRALYKQIIGRGLRLAPQINKKKCTIIDCVHNNMGMIYGETCFSALLDLNEAIANEFIEHCQEEIRCIMANNPAFIIQIGKIIDVGLEKYIPKPIDYVEDYNLYYEYDKQTNIIYGSGSKYDKINKTYIPLYWQIKPFKKGYQAYCWSDTQHHSTLQEAFDWIYSYISNISGITKTSYRNNDMERTKATSKQLNLLLNKLSEEVSTELSMSNEAIRFLIKTQMEQLSKLQCYHLLDYYMGGFEKTKNYYKKKGC